MKRMLFLLAILCGCGGGAGGGEEEEAPGYSDPSQPPADGGSVAVTVDAGQTLGAAATLAGSNHTGLTAYAPAEGLSLVPDLKAIPYRLNRIHFFGTTPDGDDFSRLPQTSPSTWNFGPLDKVVRVAAQLRQEGNQDFIFCVSYCPTWMTASGQPTTAPADSAVFAQYCERLVRYYNLGGFADDGGTWIANPQGVIGIHYWEIWNEPDDTLYVDESPAAFTPAEYAALFQTAAAAMRSADPTIAIGGPNTAWDHESYVAALLASGAPVDFLSVHQYRGEASETDAVIMAQAEPATAVASSLPLVIGEINALSDWDDPRMAGHFELAYMPLAYRAHVESGTHAVIRWETVESAFPVLNLDGTRHRTYWMERHFWSAAPPGAVRVSCGSSSSDIACLALVEGGKLRVILVNRGVASPSDRNGSGIRYEITVALPAGLYETVVVDRNTDAAAGPTPSTVEASLVTLTIDGYGMAVIRQQ